jgi:hypothetical protein
MENIVRYIIQASFSQERMIYIADESKVVNKVKDNDRSKSIKRL